MIFSYRAGLTLFLDSCAVVIAWVVGYFIRFNFEVPQEYVPQVFLGVLLLLPVHVAACLYSGLYRGIWAFSSLPDLKRVLMAVAITSGGLVLATAFLRGEHAVPRSMLILFPLLLLIVMAGSRLAWRMWREHALYGVHLNAGTPVVIVGAGRAGVMLVRELERTPDWRVVGLVDDDPGKRGLELFGHQVLGALGDLPRILRATGACHVILAIPSAGPEVVTRATSFAAEQGAKVFTVPRLEDLMTGRVAIASMRPVAIEDLLGRASVSVDSRPVETLLSGKAVLITGAGGSIGSELCRQLCRFRPECLILFELSEYALYALEQWFQANSPDTRIVTLIGDVRDRARLDEVFATYRPQIVFHAAAYKHVPLMEVENSWQAVQNNVSGTMRLAHCAQAYAVERFILISTDKAVNPTNVMGATKRLAEMVCEALHRHGNGITQFEIVRFGNVLGSNGSVIPKFQEQIAKGGPLTVTHPEITRYFMSIPEAAQLVLQAAAMGEGGEIFVLDMGQPVRILDLAKNMIRLSGHTEKEIPIEFTGLRHGEKLFEELLADNETTLPTHHPKLRIAQPRPVSADFLARLETWLETKRSLTDNEVREALVVWAPEYCPEKGGRSQ